MNQEFRPLVSVVVVTYNQEQVVEAAVSAVFAQDYGPLEIILSDDRSTDGTFEILERMATNYCGPHLVRLNRNEVNLGIGKHWDSISRQAKGELIVHAAGDDVSVQNRVSVLVDAWRSVNPRPTLVSSDGLIMTYEGVPVGPHIGNRWSPRVHVQRGPEGSDLDRLNIPVCGFSMAIDRRLYEVFEPITARFWAEDEILRRRALLLNGVMYVPDRLVHYRDQGLSKGAKKNQRAYLDLYMAHAETRLAMVRQSMRDVRVAKPRDVDAYLPILREQERSAERRITMVRGSFLTSVAMLARQVVGSGNEGISRGEYLRFFAVKWAPNAFFRTRNIKTSLDRWTHSGTGMAPGVKR